MKVLVTGATGYIGGRLVPYLLEHKHKVRVLVRDPKRIAGRNWEHSVDIAVGDLSDINDIESALDGIETAYYLVHSMYSGIDFVKQDRQLAKNFIVAATKSGHCLRHVIYLGGILPRANKSSRHLQSRAEVGEMLRSFLPTTEFRAGPIIGSGSASFEMLRYFVQRLPIMIVPTWILNEVQPIAIRDILSYLTFALNHKPLEIVEVGSERVTFKEMIVSYAKIRGLMKRIIITVPPLLPPKQVARWLVLVTPIPDALAIPIVEGICHSVVADVSKAHETFPEVQPISFRLAAKLALEKIQNEAVATSWSGAIGTPYSYDVVDREGIIREVRSLHVDVSPEAVYKSFSTIGGKRGWLVWKWAWEIRGLIDKIAGGPGLRRGRRNPTELLPGEALDFWRVESIEPHKMLRLRAEMKVPGRAWIKWEVIPEKTGARLVQTAMFEPKGFWGAFYWYTLYPIHKKIFSDLILAIAKDATLGMGIK